MEIPKGYKQTELGIIPEDWEIVYLNVIGNFSKGRGISREEARTGNLPAIRYGEIYTSHNDYIKIFCSYINPTVARMAKQIFYGDILFASSGETKEEIGKSVAYINDAVAYAGGDIIILSLDKYHYSPQFIGYATNAPYVIRQKSAKGQGDAVVHISKESLGDIALCVPKNKEEQTAIADALSDVDGLIAALERKIAKKRLIKQGAMQQLLTGKKRLPGFTQPWVEMKLGDIAILYQPTTISQNNFSIYGYDVYGANGIIGKYHQYNHKTDQVMITCRGNSCGAINYSVGYCWITGNAMVLNMDKNKWINKRFIYYLLVITNLSDLITGSGQPQIVRNSLQEYTINIPNNAQEQIDIATILSDMDKEIANLEARRDKYKLVKNGMMQKLLTGQIRLVTPCTR